MEGSVVKLFVKSVVAIASANSMEIIFFGNNVTRWISGEEGRGKIMATSIRLS